MKILHVAYIYPPKLEVADGITAVVYNVTRELARRGHEVAVYTSDMLDLHGNDSLRSGHSVINGVDVYYSRSVWRSKTFIVTPNLFSLLSKDLGNYDVIHIHDCRSFQGISAFLFSRMRNVRYVFQPHGSYLSSLPESLAKSTARLALDKLVSHRIINNASRIIALSQVEAMQLRTIGVSEDKIAVIPNGIDLSEYASLQPKGSFKKKFDLPENNRIILYLGRIHKTKGLDLLVKAYAYLVKSMKHDDAHLVIAGPDDGYLSEIKSLSAHLNVSDSVLFTGFISDSDKLKALVDADVFVTPSFHGFPVTFLEAGITSTPIVTTSLGDTLDWIEGRVGYVTRPTCHELARAIHAILSNDDLRQQFSRNSRCITQSEFSSARVIDKLEQVYREVVGK